VKEPDALSLSVEPAGDREVKLAFVRKLMLALQKHDEHGALDALEGLVEECGESTYDDDEE
jgi:hypothetical protein